MLLHIRISDTDICFAHYEKTGAPEFQFQPYHVRPQASLTVNLRLAMQQVALLQQQYERVEVYVNAPVTPIPLVEFQEEDVETTYNFCFSPMRSAASFTTPYPPPMWYSFLPWQRVLVIR